MPVGLSVLDIETNEISSLSTGDVKILDPLKVDVISPQSADKVMIYAEKIENGYSTASGQYTLAHGESCTASGVGSHAEGLNTISAFAHSHSEGIGTVVMNAYQHVTGKYNKTTGLLYNDTGAFVVGNGPSAISRSNILYAGGDKVYIEGKIINTGEIRNTTAGEGIVLKSPNGTSYKITVSDAGALSVVLA